VNPDGVFFNESAPVNDEGLAEVRGTGPVTPIPLPPGDAAVILWDEQPKTKLALTTTSGGGNGPQAASTSIRVR